MFPCYYVSFTMKTTASPILRKNARTGLQRGLKNKEGNYGKKEGSVNGALFRRLASFICYCGSATGCFQDAAFSLCLAPRCFYRLANSCAQVFELGHNNQQCTAAKHRHWIAVLLDWPGGVSPPILSTSCQHILATPVPRPIGMILETSCCFKAS